MKRSFFSGNRGQDGGAIEIGLNSYIVQHFTDCSVLHELMTSPRFIFHRPLIHATDSASILSLQDSHVVRNSANKRGGAIYCANAILNIFNTTFLSSESNEGSAIYLSTSIEIPQSQRGSANYSESSISFRVENSTFSDSIALDGSTLKIVCDQSYCGLTSISDSVFSRNIGSQGGGVSFSGIEVNGGMVLRALLNRE